MSNLKGANFYDAILVDADLTDADFCDSAFGNTVMGNLDFSTTHGIDSIRHAEPSILGVDTIFRSKGKIPEVFLRGCGLSDLQIEMARLATSGLDSEQVTDISYKIHQLYIGGGIRYYSCFISYNNRDEEFFQKLHNDLQNSSVRCWFAPEDLMIGDQIRPRIDQELRLRDKLLIILSENSLKSQWVGDEVEAAFEEEIKSNRLVLFPIRLDSSVMSASNDWAAKIKRRRHIGNFSNWKDKASYQKAFERLLRDLNATGG
jgi:hypothetical protein